VINRAMQINPNLPEVLAVKGWLLNEIRSDEALPLLRVTAESNDASKHRFLGDLTTGWRGDAMNHFSAAAADPMDFICMCSAARNSWTSANTPKPPPPARARELDPTHMGTTCHLVDRARRARPTRRCSG
jgi:hypothetical protein